MKVIASFMSVLYSIGLSNAINSYCGPRLKSISHGYGVTIYFDIIIIELLLL